MQLLETSTPSTLQAVAIFLAVLDCVAVSLRLYTRQFLGQTIKIDDWFALLSFFFVLALTVYFIIGISKEYVGYPIPEDFTGEEPHPLIGGSLQHFYIWCTLLFPALWCIKCSFILFYRRVLVADKGNFRDWANILVIFSFGLVTVWSVAFGFTWVFACRPVKAFWSFPYGADEGPCLDTWKLHRGISISDFIVDVLILIIPVPMVWRLHLKWTRKLAVLIVFFLGAIAVAASIMRMVRVIWASSDADSDADGLLVNTTVLFWGLIEADLGLLAACLPTMRGLLKTRTMDSLMKSYRSRTWLRSSQRSGSKSGDQDGIPLTNPPTPATPAKSFGGFRKKDPHDITLTTLDSVVTTSNMSQVR